MAHVVTLLNSIKRVTCNFLPYSALCGNLINGKQQFFSLFSPLPPPQGIPRRETVHRGKKNCIAGRHRFVLHTEGTLREARPDVCRPEVNIIPVGASSSPRNATMRRLCAFHSPAGGFAFENSLGDAVEGETTHRPQNYSRRRWRRIRRREQAIFRIFRYAERTEEKLLALLSRRPLKFFSRNGSLEDHDYRCFSSYSYRSFISSPALLKRGFARSPPS